MLTEDIRRRPYNPSVNDVLLAHRKYRKGKMQAGRYCREPAWILREESTRKTTDSENPSDATLERMRI